MLLRRLAPWLIAFEVLKAGRDHWDRLDPSDRARVRDLMRRSKGDPRKLTASDRKELRDLSRRLDLAKLALSLGTAVALGRRRHKRRGR
jgi:hypothetical protein